MTRAQLYMLAAALGLGAAWIAYRRSPWPGRVDQVAASGWTDWTDSVFETVTGATQDAAEIADDLLYKVAGVRVMDWQTAAAKPENQAYVDAMRAAERINGMPADLLVRVAWQESHFRHDIITGKKTSGAGAVGIMQIVPRWHPDVDPLDPFASIAYAGKYLAALYRQTGSWPDALAAYNWGIGNLQQYGIARAPAETREYVASISADVGLA